MSPASIRRRALLLFVLASAAVSDATTLECQNDCDYGILPGLWRDQGKPQWQLVSQCCQLRDLVGEARHAPADWNSTEDEDPAVRILIFGDSVERITLHDLCDQDQWDNWGHDQTLFHSCRRGRVLLSRQSMIGVNPDGPYHMGMTGSPFQRILNVRPLSFADTSTPNFTHPRVDNRTLRLRRVFRPVCPTHTCILP